MPVQLKKTIGLWPATSIVIGSIIGSGIFMKPASMAMQLQSPLWLIATWLIAGVFSLFGALIYAEAGAMFPETGGQYVFFRHMYGPFAAFLYGWAGFAVINTASVSAIAFVCASYADCFLHLPALKAATVNQYVVHIPLLGNLYPLGNIGVKLLAVGLVLGLSFLNYLSVRASNILQVSSTVIKIAVILLLVAGIFFSGNGSIHYFTEAPFAKHGWPLAGGIVAALTGAFMAYDGWVNITLVGGEVQLPKKNIPKSLLMGLACCIIVYLLVNLAYLYVLPVEKMAASPLVAADAIAAALGKTGSLIIAVLIVICTFGAINGNVMTIARVTYAMGRDRLFFSWTGREHRRFQTPGNALWLHGTWASILIISGSFDMLADMFTFISWVAYLMGAIGIIILRKKMPAAPRPYKTSGYPAVPIAFILFAAFYVVSTIWNDIRNYLSGQAPVINSLLGMAITASGIPLYWFFRRRAGDGGTETGRATVVNK